jgi:hypothetical protein
MEEIYGCAWQYPSAGKGWGIVPYMNSRTIFCDFQIIGRVSNKKEQPTMGVGKPV